MFTYSVNRSPAMKRDCLRNCVDAYGKDRVITQIKYTEGIKKNVPNSEKKKSANGLGGNTENNTEAGQRETVRSLIVLYG